MTRPTVLDMNLVVVPPAPDNEMLAAVWSVRMSNGKAVAEVCYESMLSASPDPAWDDVRKYVEGLEKECERLKFLVEWGEAFCDMKHPDTARAESAEARIAELEKRLADAERVIEPFAALPDAPHGKRSYFLELLVRPEGDDPADGVKHYGPAIRAARAYMEGK